jgi:hypothetical protein
MNDKPFSEFVERSVQIRKNYHQLERELHKKKWTIEEDALAFLTDAGLIGRHIMAHEGRWPLKEYSASELKHKLAECIWWVIVMADRMDIDIQDSFENFLSKTEQQLK